MHLYRMQTIAIYSPELSVRRILLEYVVSRSYRNITVSQNEKEIRADDGSLFKNNKFHFKVIEINPEITNIQLEVNPQHETPTSGDLKKETTICEKLFTYF
jgi:hypothetical protein